MKGQIINPDGTIEAVEYEGREPTLQEMQDIVGGNIEIASVLNEQEEHVHMIVNEEGLIHGRSDFCHKDLVLGVDMWLILV